MEIKHAIESDYKECSKLYRKLYSELEEIKIQEIPFDYKDFKNILLIAKNDNKIIGFIWGNFIAFGLGKYGYIEDLYVDKEYRNKGVAKSLILSIKEEFKQLKVSTVFVTTEKENTPAINLYLKEGFETCPGPWFQWIP